MSFFNRTLSEIWDNLLHDELTQLPSWFFKLHFYLFWIFCLSPLVIFWFGRISRYAINTYIEITDLLKHCSAQVRDDNKDMQKCRRNILDGYTIMFLDSLIRPIFTVVRYLIVDIIGCIINQFVKLYRYISNQISSRSDNRVQNIEPVENTCNICMVNLHKECNSENISLPI